VPNPWIESTGMFIARLVVSSLCPSFFLHSFLPNNNNNLVLTVNDPKTQVGHLFLLIFSFFGGIRRAGDRLSFISASRRRLVASSNNNNTFFFLFRLVVIFGSD
jgi:hypothetical protein